MQITIEQASNIAAGLQQAISDTQEGELIDLEAIIAFATDNAARAELQAAIEAQAKA
jgi:hypothetical protein